MTSASVLAHLLRIAGAGPLLSEGRLTIVGPDAVDASCLETARGGGVVILLSPSDDVAARLGVHVAGGVDGAWTARWTPDDAAAFASIRGFGPARALDGDALEPVLVSPTGATLWGWLPVGSGGLFICGTDVAADIVRFRQGDPRRTPTHDEEERWGYAGERPNYLFESDLDPERPDDRPADWPIVAICTFVAQKLGAALAPPLPDGAPCAVVITGDTDGATPEHYAEQRQLLGDLPITYFLRTACAAPDAELRALDADPRVDLQLHPDALDAPDRYPDLLAEQVAFFETRIGRRPSSVRNHGYLNDGYWRHAAAWLAQDIHWSANLPGVDGVVLNGSLTPARLVLDGTITPHWSLVTPFGDGMIFAPNASADEAAAAIEARLDAVASSGVPGVVAINLHPANVPFTPALHDCLHRLSDKGVLMWTLAQCADWFERRDRADA